MSHTVPALVDKYTAGSPPRDQHTLGSTAHPTKGRNEVRTEFIASSSRRKNNNIPSSGQAGGFGGMKLAPKTPQVPLGETHRSSHRLLIPRSAK